MYPCIYLSIHLSIHPSKHHLCIHPSIHTSFMYPFIIYLYPSIHPFIHPSMYISINLSIYPFMYSIYHLSIVLIPSPYIQFRTLFPSSIQIKKLNWNLKAIPTLIVNGSHNPFINYNSSHSSPDVTTWLWGFALIQTQASVRSGPDIG